MSYSEHDDAIRAMLRRAALTADADDRETQQKVDLRGLKRDEPRAVHRLQMPGLSSVAIKGGEGYMSPMGGRSDRLLFIGGEHKDHRPKGKEPGDTVLYDHHGHAISLIKASMRIVHSKLVEIEAPEIVLKGKVYLGGKDGAKLVHRKGDKDSGGDLAEESATKVYAL